MAAVSYSSVVVPEAYTVYALSFLRAMFAITSDSKEFEGAYQEHLQRFPVDPSEDYDDEC